MRRRYTNRMVVAIALVLAAATLLFAWIRSREVMIVVDPPDAPVVDEMPEEIPIEDETFEWARLGEEVYNRTAGCLACHGEGEGVGDAPGLAGHAVELFEAEGGRDYLAAHVLWGVEGTIEIEGETREADHPSFEHLEDDELAAVLNHVLTAWNNARQLSGDTILYLPDDLAAARADDLSPGQVRALRP